MDQYNLQARFARAKRPAGSSPSAADSRDLRAKTEGTVLLSDGARQRKPSPGLGGEASGARRDDPYNLQARFAKAKAPKVEMPTLTQRHGTTKPRDELATASQVGTGLQSLRDKARTGSDQQRYDAARNAKKWGAQWLDAGAAELQTLRKEYEADPTEERRVAYNKKYDTFLSERVAYDQLMDIYDELDVIEGGKVRETQLQRKLDAANKSVENAKNGLSSAKGYNIGDARAMNGQAVAQATEAAEAWLSSAEAERDKIKAELDSQHDYNLAMRGKQSLEMLKKMPGVAGLLQEYGELMQDKKRLDGRKMVVAAGSDAREKNAENAANWDHWAHHDMPYLYKKYGQDYENGIDQRLEQVEAKLVQAGVDPTDVLRSEYYLSWDRKRKEAQIATVHAEKQVIAKETENASAVRRAFATANAAVPDTETRYLDNLETRKTRNAELEENIPRMVMLANRGTAATDEEMKEAEALAHQLYLYLLDWQNNSAESYGFNDEALFTQNIKGTSAEPIYALYNALLSVKRADALSVGAIGLGSAIPGMGAYFRLVSDISKEEATKDGRVSEYTFLPEGYNEMDAIIQSNPTAFKVGQGAGDLGVMLLGGKLLGGTSVVKSLPTAAQRAVTSGTMMALTGANDALTEGASIGEAIHQGAIHGIGGATGSLVANEVTDLGTKALFGVDKALNTKFAHNVFANAVNQGFGGAAFALANAGTRAQLDPNYNPTGEELVKDAIVSLAFQTISSAVHLKAQTKAAKAALDSDLAELERDFYRMAEAQKAGVVTETDLVDAMRARSARLRNTLNSTQYIGHGQEVKDALAFLDQLDDFIAQAGSMVNARTLPGMPTPVAEATVGGDPAPTAPTAGIMPTAGGTPESLPTASGLDQAQKTASTGEAELPRMTMADFTDTASPVWRNVAYEDKETQRQITQATHQQMVSEGRVVTVPESTAQKVAPFYPNVRALPRAEKNSILKEKTDALKRTLRQFLGGLRDTSFEFEVNGNILEAKLYGRGISEVMKKLTQDKASMLYHSGEIFKGAQYLYSTPDYDGDPNIYRWNYFYTPVQIGSETVGVRIAVRDMAKQRESQIYHWGIKKGTSLDGDGDGVSRKSIGVSSDAPDGTPVDAGSPDVSVPSSTGVSLGVPKDTIPQTSPDVKTAEARVAQIERQIAELDRQDVARGVEDLGMQGKSTVTAMYLEGQNAQSYVQGMRTLYEAGKAGVSMDLVTGEAVGSLNEYQRKAAYDAGRIDAAANSQTLGKVESQQGQQDDLPFYFGSEEGAVNNGETGTVRVRDGGQRPDGAGAQVAAGGVAEGTGGLDARADRGGPADPGAGALQVGRAVSTRALGIADGLDTDSVRLVTGGETQSLRQARSEAQGQGLELVAFAGGNLHVQVPDSQGNIITVEARGYIAGNKVYVRADHAEVTGYQLWRHELYHNLKDARKVSPRATMEAVREQLGDELTDKLEAAYSRALGGITGVELWEEIAADQYGGINFFSKALLEEEMVPLYDAVGAQTDAQLSSQTAEATDSTTGPPQGGKTSIEHDVNNVPFVVIEEDILEGVAQEDWAETVKKTLRKRFPKGVTVARSHIKINAQTIGEFSRSGYTRWLRDTAPDIYADKFRAAANMDEVLLATRNYVDEGLNHPRKDNIKEFARGTVQLRVGQNDYIADVVVGTTKDGSMVLYDLVNILPTTIEERKQSQTGPKPQKGAGSRTSESASEKNVPHQKPEVKGKSSQEPGGYVQELREQRTELEERGRREGWDPERMEEEVRAAVQRVYKGRSLSEDGGLYRYDFLTELPDMKATALPDVDAVRTAEGKVDTRRVVELGMKNARAVGTKQDGKIFIQNLYTGRGLRLDAASIRHGLNGSLNRLLTNARLGAVIGDVVQNAVPINALTNQAEGVTGTYAMAGYATDGSGREFVAIVTVEQRSGQVDGIEVYDVTHAVSGRQKRGERVDTKSQGVYPSTNASMVSIADFLRIVKETHQSILSDDVLRHFDESKNPAGYYTGKAKFSQEPSGYVQELREQRTELEERGRREGWDPERMEEEVRAAVQSALQSLIDEYGAIKPGEKRAREVQVPRKTGKHEKVSQTVRTILEAGATPEAAVPTIEELTAKGEFSYGPLSDKTAIKRAEGTIQNLGWDRAQREWFNGPKKGLSGKDYTTVGWLLYNNAANTGNTQLAMDILARMVSHQREAAQAVQATRILKQMDPETQLYGVQRSVMALQEELNQRFGEDKGPKLVISQELAEQLLAATDQEGRDRVMQDIYRDIGRQMPSSFADKWNAWRYLSMLGNVRTHVRNIMGNAGFTPVVVAKDMTATAIERAVSAVSGGRLERSKAMVGLGAKGRGLLAAAWGDYAKVQDAAMGGGKYSEFQNANKYIEEGRVIFKSKPGKAVETARRANSKALDAEDMWFSKPHYAYAMAQYCAANGITEETIRAGDAKALNDARAYAIREAQKATYRDTNALSQMLGGLGRDLRRSKYGAVRGAGLLVEGVLPFRKTPANILARGLEYSPLGLVKGLSYDLYQVRKGNMTGAEAIDHISAGLTGTGLLALGMFLAAQGLLRGKGPGDDKERELAKLQGHQDYSLEIGDVSITLDWLAPEVLPLFVGANLWETAQTDGELTMSDMLSAVSNVSDPLLEMSCLQSLNDIFDSVGYASQGDTSPLVSVLVSGATSYLTQGLPTIFGQGERVFETQRESTFTSKDAFLTGDAQYFLGKVSGKVPVWEYQQVPYVDAWGRTEDTGSLGERAFNNLLNPAYVSQVETSPMEEELVRLYEATGENVFPSRAKKYFQVKGERRDLSAEEYVDYATRKGQTARKVAEALVEHKSYRDLEDGAKAEAVADAYKYAEQVARQAVAKDYEPDSWVTKAQTAERSYKIPVETFILLRNQCAGMESIKDKDGESIANSKGLQIMEAVYAVPGLRDSQRRYLFEALGAGKSIQHYNKALVKEKLKRMR